MGERRRSAVLLAAFVALLAGGIARADSGQVAIANAGVLGNVVTGLKTLVPGVTINNTTGGSVALAQGIASGAQVAELFGSADASVNKYLLGNANQNKERWFAALGRNAIVMQYSANPSDPHAADFAKAAAGQEPWYQPLITGPPINLCRTSPDADPSGYYTLFVMQLASKFYKLPNLKQQVLGDDRNPVQTSATCATGKSLANGTLDVSFTYLSGALSNPSQPFLRLPPEVNLSDQTKADVYAQASFTNSAGQTFHGGVIRPSIAPVEGAANPDSARQVLLYLFTHKGSVVEWTYNFMPSGLYAGGDPTAIPPDLRPYFNLRRLQVSVSLDKTSCSTSRLAVSGDGVTATHARARAGGTCRITIDVSPGQTRMRDLMVVRKETKSTANVQGRTALVQKFGNAVDLSTAIPVVPDFLQ
jgi:molybdate/tungstate transport system substrate-binding protein